MQNVTRFLSDISKSEHNLFGWEDILLKSTLELDSEFSWTMQVFILHKRENHMRSHNGHLEKMRSHIYIPKVDKYFEWNKIPGDCCVEGAQNNFFFLSKVVSQKHQLLHISIEF